MRISSLLVCALVLASGCDDGTGPSEARVASIRLSQTAAPLDDGATLQLTAEPLDRGGRALPAGTVRLAWSSSDEAVATVADGLVTGRRPGEARITATAGAASASAQVTVRPVPAALGAAAGAAQEGVAGMAAPQEIVALVTDRHGGGVPGVAVEFVVVRGGGTVVPASAQTDAQGRARAAWTLGNAAGENVVEARAAGRALAPALFAAVGKAGAPARLEKLSGDAQQSAAASQLPLPLVVRVADAHGNPVAGASVSWRSSHGGSAAPAVSVTDAAGEARATWLLGPGAGEQAVEARVEGSAAAPVQFGARAGVGAAARLEKTGGDGQEAMVTSPLPEPMVVRAVDAPGNPVPGVRVAWKLFYGGGTVAPPESVTDAQGYARATWTLGTIMAHHRLEVRMVDAALPPVTFTAFARVGAAANLAKHGGDAQESEVGYTLTTPLVVRATDAHGNPVPGVPVQWSGTGSMKSAESETDTLGLARGTWVLGTTAGAQTMSATAAGKTVSFTASARQGPARAVKVSPDALFLPPGESAQLEVDLTDLFGNVGDGRGRGITWSSSSPAVAAVSASGLVRAVSVGDAVVTATGDGVSGSTRVTVGRVSVRDLGADLRSSFDINSSYYSEVFGINEAGDAVGYGSFLSSSNRAFLWKRGGETIDLGDLSPRLNSYTQAWAINAAGQIVGSSNLDDYRTHAFLWQNGRMIDLAPDSYHSVAHAINDAGQVVGEMRSFLGENHAFLWRGGVLTDLGTLAGFSSNARGINSAGQVVGYSRARDGELHAFLWQNGVMRDLGTLGGRFSWALGINDAGQVVGFSAVANGDTHAFLWQNGVMTDLGTLGGRSSRAFAISADGIIVGSSSTAAGDDEHAFYWVGGAMIDLGTLGGPRSSARGINAAGQIVGSSVIRFGATHAALWTVR